MRWTAADRGAVSANARRALPDAVDLSLLPVGPVGPVGPEETEESGEPIVVHDVLFDVADGYRPTESVWSGARGAREAWLWVEVDDGRVAVDRLPGDAAYPIRTGPGRLFTLAAGQIGRYRANFRFAGTAQWFYEQWTVHCAYG